MSVDRPDFLQAYEAVEVPEPLSPQEIGEEPTEEVIETFFNSITQSLDLSKYILDEYFSRELETNDPTIETFRRRGGLAIASVYSTYDESGTRAEVRFLKRTLPTRIQSEIRAWRLMDLKLNDLD